MSIFNIFKLEVKRILKSKEFYTSIVLSLLFGSALVYTIKIDQGPFTINAVSSFYGIVPTILQNITLVNGIPESVGLFIKNMPFYFSTIRTKKLQIGTIEVLITIIGSGILFISNYYSVTREDY